MASSSKKSKQQTIFNFLPTTPQQIVTIILKDIISNVIDIVDKPKRKHSSVKDATYVKWKKQFPWLEVDNSASNTALKCKWCAECKADTLWATEGSVNVQLSSISRHVISSEHVQSEKKILNELISEDEKSDQCDVIRSPDTILLQTVYYCALEGIPSDKINSLLEFQYMQGVGEGVASDENLYKNVSWDTVNSIQDSISDALTREIINQIKESDFYGIMIDESTDVSIDKKLAVCVRYVINGESVTHFLCNVKISSGHAHVIVSALISKLASLGLDVSKLVWLATDGAAVMTGKKTGVGVQLKGKYSPFMLQSHCIAHRLNLAIIDSTKPHKWLSKLSEKLNSLFYFMRGSANRTHLLTQMQKMFEQPEISIKEPHSIRWLGMRNAISALYRCYSSVLAALSKLAAEKNSTSLGLYRYFSDFHVAMSIAFLLDIHEVLADLSKDLQKADLSFSELQPLTDGTISELEQLKNKGGESEIKMRNEMDKRENDEIYFFGEKMKNYSKKSDELLTKRKVTYVDKLIANIKSRFTKEDSDILNDLCALLEPDRVNERGSEKDSEAAVKAVGLFYGSEKTCVVYDGDVRTEIPVKPLLDEKRLEEEWVKLSGMIRGAYKSRNLESLCKRVIKLHASVLPNFAVLCRIALCVSVTSVECERVFSMQNRLKSKFRARLSPARLNTLFTIQSLGCDMALYNPSQAIKIWHSKAKRRKGRLCMQYKPLKCKKSKV